MTKIELRKRRNRVAAKKHYYKMAIRHEAQGLTRYAGTVPKTVDSRGHKIGKRYIIKKGHRILHGEERSAELRRLWRERNKSNGLRVDGKPRKNMNHNLPQAMFNGVYNIEIKRANERAKWKVYSARRIAAGLNAHNKPRKDFGAPTDLEKAWREFRSTITVPFSRSWSEYIGIEERNAA